MNTSSDDGTTLPQQGEQIPTSWCVPSAGCHDDPTRSSLNGNSPGLNNWTRALLVIICLAVAYAIARVFVYICCSRHRESVRDDDDKTVSIAGEEDNVDSDPQVVIMQHPSHVVLHSTDEEQCTVGNEEENDLPSLMNDRQTHTEETSDT